MENATKALLIAAAILIAIVVITLGVFVLGKGTSLVKENSDMSGVEIDTYNSKFETYCGENVRGAQVKQLINAINAHNRENAGDESKQITLDKNAKNVVTEAKDVKTGETYVVTIEKYTTGGLIEEMRIVSNKVKEENKTPNT